MAWWMALGVLSVAVATWLFLAVRAAARARGVRVVHCPATGGSASLRLRAPAPFTPRRGRLRVGDCSQWPERRHCAQACLAEVEAAPHHCTFRRILAAWYRGRCCAFCGREVPEIQWGELRPALLAPEGELVAWSEIPPARLYEVLATHRPVCAGCDVAETFRRRHADWVVERPRDGAPPAA